MVNSGKNSNNRNNDYSQSLLENPELTEEFNDWLESFIPSNIDTLMAEANLKKNQDKPKMAYEKIYKEDMPLNTIKQVDPSSYMRHIEVRNRGEMVITDDLKLRYSDKQKTIEERIKEREQKQKDKEQKETSELEKLKIEQIKIHDKLKAIEKR